VPEAPIGYAVVGLGWISQAAVLPAFRNARGNSRLAALVSGDPEKRGSLADRYDLRSDATFGYEEYEACLDRDDVDAVYIAVPNHLHREYTVRAAERGVHVLCEKPMAGTEEDCRAMIQACDAAGVQLMVAYRLHLEPANLHLVDLVQSGRIGRPRSFDAVFTESVAEDDIRLEPPGKGGGPLYDIGVYCINAARYLFQAEPESVVGMRASRPQAPLDQASEMLSCALRFPGGRLASFTCGFGAHAVSTLQLVGDAGSLRMTNAFNFRGDRQLEAEGHHDQSRTFPETDHFGPQLAYFSDCVIEDRTPEPDGEEGLIDVRIIQALYDSLDRGRPVELSLRRDRRPVPGMAMEYPAVPAPELVGAAEPSA
jgi:predicted dehydrogenase